MPYTPEQLAFLTGQYRQGQPMTLMPGQAIPQDQYRADQPGMMPFASVDAQKAAANGMMGRVAEQMKGFALPDVSKYGYSPESQGRVEGAGYLRETPIGIFGGAPKPAGLFGNSAASANPASPASIGQIGIETPQALPQRSGMFGGGKANWMGIIGDALLAAAGRQPIYSPSVMAQRKAEQDAMAAQAERAASMEDWRTKYDYEMKNPKPVNNDTVNDYNFILSQLGPDAANNYLRQMGDRFITTTLPNDQFYAGPQSGLAAALGGQAALGNPVTAPPQKPVGKLTPITGGQPAGQPPFAGKGGYVPPMTLAGGRMTSGRRTVEGNRLVGGVPNSPHIPGHSADYVGPNLAAILEEARKLPGIKKAFIHNAGSGSHVHTEGEGWNVPYYGKNGTRGR